MERRDDLVNHAFLGDIVSDNNFEKYRQQIRRSLETRPPKTLQQLREEAAKKAQEEKKKEEESVEPSATKEQVQEFSECSHSVIFLLILHRISQMNLRLGK